MKNGKTVTLAIESSCDETAAAVLLDGREVLSNIISSQIDLHKLYGGVVPEIASRHHLTNVNTVVDQALDAAKVTMDEVDLIGVTYGPGLVGALLIGLATAKAYALKMQQIFGNDSFYLELKDHGIRLQKQVNLQLLRLSSETGIPVVATNDVHYLKKSDAEDQAI